MYISKLKDWGAKIVDQSAFPLIGAAEVLEAAEKNISGIGGGKKFKGDHLIRLIKRDAKGRAIRIDKAGLSTPGVRLRNKVSNIILTILYKKFPFCQVLYPKKV